MNLKMKNRNDQLSSKCLKACLFLFLSMVLITFSNRAYAGISEIEQEKQITGTIADASGEPIIGANVVESGTTNGTVTDIDGKFRLSVANNAVIRVSYIGYLPQDINTTGSSTFDVILQEDTKSLDELVVIGYGVAKKSDLTGSVASVSNKQFRDQPVKRLGDVLQGRTPGVQVTTLSGMPGGSMKVRVRGTTSINKSSDPLYVVDGIVGGSYQMGDIQSIEVLKDASATAIYGSRGANGVVLITTRSGQAGRMLVEFDAQVGVSKMIEKYDLMDAYEYAQALNHILSPNTISAEDMEAYRNGTKGIDWVDMMTQTGLSQDYKLTISGGTAQSRYLISGNILNQDGVTITNNYKRYNLRANIDSDVKPWLSISTKINAATSHNHNNGVDLLNTFAYSPTMEMRNEETGVYYEDPYNTLGANPYASRVENYNDNYSYSLNANTALIFKIIDGLTLSVQGGYNFSYSPTYAFVSKWARPSQINSMNNNSSMTRYWQNTNNLTYQKSFGDHNLTATAVWEQAASKSTALNISGTNLAEEAVGYWNVGNAATKSQSNSYSEYSLASGLARVMYNYKSRYFVTGTFRADGSSKFQGDNKWGYFPSAAVAWDAAQEDFMGDQDIFDQLKLRASYGITGNQGIDAYSTLGMLSATSYGWGTTTDYTGYWGNTFATPGLRWEETHQYDVGVDASVLGGKINFSIDGFLKQSKGLLFQKSVPRYNGGGTFWVNQGEVQNSGLDFSITAYPLENREVTWETSFNGTYVKNEIVDMGGVESIYSSHSTYGGDMQVMRVGYPLGSFYLFDHVGFDENGANLYQKQNGTTTIDPAGDDMVVMGKSEPSWTFGWNNMVTYKNWTFSAFLNAAAGAERLNWTRSFLGSTIAGFRFVRLRDSFFKGWDYVENKADAKYPSITNSDNKIYPNSDFWLEDASFIKLKNISVAYNIPNDVVKFADVQLSLSAQDLFILTKYQGSDPEVYTTFLGIDQGAYPVPRTVTFGARITF